MWSVQTVGEITKEASIKQQKGEGGGKEEQKEGERTYNAGTLGMIDDDRQTIGR